MIARSFNERRFVPQYSSHRLQAIRPCVVYTRKSYVFPLVFNTDKRTQNARVHNAVLYVRLMFTSVRASRIERQRCTLVSTKFQIENYSRQSCGVLLLYLRFRSTQVRSTTRIFLLYPPLSLTIYPWLNIQP